jgi:hypothetical protein
MHHRPVLDFVKAFELALAAILCIRASILLS